MSNHGIMINDEGNSAYNQNPFRQSYRAKSYMQNNPGGDRFSFDPTPHF